jgi:hypothetical protein
MVRQGPIRAENMAPFPEHLLEGYRTFTSQRLPTEQTRYRELSERGQSAAVTVIGCFRIRENPRVRSASAAAAATLVLSVILDQESDKEWPNRPAEGPQECRSDKDCRKRAR